MSQLDVHVEVRVFPESAIDYTHVEEEVRQHLADSCSVFRDGPVDFSANEMLSQVCQSIHVVDIDDSRICSGIVHFWQAVVHIHVYRLSSEGSAEEEDEVDPSTVIFHQWMIPASELHGSWNSLIYDRGMKEDLLEYVNSAMLFADKEVDQNLISWNRVVLLHGPPGSGKTSLAKALAHKLSIRLSNRFPQGGLLVEVNSHSLFSKWFSESGKLVSRMFKQVEELAEDRQSLVCVLIDEVESLSASRKSAMGGSEPSDAIRVVNALLTNIDKLKQFPNVLVLTTSNITGAIDLAFVDRADIKLYIGPPGVPSRYQILRTSLFELFRSGIVEQPDHNSPDGDDTSSAARIEAMYDDAVITENGSLSHTLSKIAGKAEGYSGRALRKIPFLAHAHYIRRKSCTAAAYLAALEQALDRETEDRSHLAET